MANVAEFGQQAISELSKVVKFPAASVVGISPEDHGWRVDVEIVEKVSIPDAMDILGTYEVHLDSNGSLQNYHRKYLRKRGDMVIGE